MATLKYQYTSLSHGEIRLLEVQPGQGAQKIQCTLHKSDIAAKHSIKYEALSYSWGNPNVTLEVELEGFIFSVTTNLFLALQRLRRKDVPRMLWVDAICIDQVNTPEKQLQLPMMGDIYRKAERVVIWLGPSSQMSKDVFAFFQSFSWRRGEESNGPGDPLLRERGLTQLRKMLVTDPEAREAIRFYIKDIASREWWTRLWIIQEATLARELVVHCGNDHIPWHDLVEIMSQLDPNDLGTKRLIQDAITGLPGIDDRLDWSGGLWRLADIDGIRLIAQKTKTPLQLFDLVACCRAAKATEPKDMIYGFLGLADSSQLPRFLPDYSKTNSEVYTDFTEMCILSTNSLDILTMSKFPDSNPSWVPDWTRYSAASNSTVREDRPAEPLVWRFRSTGYLQTHLQPEERSKRWALDDTWCAAWHSLPEVTISRRSEGQAILGAKGVRVGTISALGTLRHLIFDPIMEDWELLFLKKFGTAKTPTHDGGILDFTDRWFQLLVKLAILDAAEAHFRQEIPEAADFPKLVAFMARLSAWSSPKLWFIWLKRKLKRTWRAIRYRSEGEEYVGGGTLVDAYVRTLAGDIFNEARFGNGDYYKGFWSGDRPTGRDSIYNDEGGESLYRLHLLGAFTDLSTQRRMMVTDSGYMGLVSDHARVGDLVVVLKGCSVPVLLRPVGDHFVFAGESFVQGLMDGEAMEQMTTGVLQEELFQIH